MKQQNQGDQNIQKALVSEYEAMSQKGTVGFYEETVFLTLIDHYHQAELLNKAIEVIDHAIYQHAYSATFHKRKAQILLEKGCASQALRSLDQAELYAPAELEVAILRVESLNMLGDHEEAHLILDEWEQKEHCAKTLSEIFLYRAIIFEYKQEFEAMFQALEQAIILDPENEQALERVWFSVEMSDSHKESIRLHEKLIDINPYNYVAWYNLGYSFAALEDYRNAAEAFEYAFLINEEFEFAYRDCAHAHMKIGEYTRALEIYQEALEFVKPDSDLLMNIGHCMEALGKYSKAKSLYLKATQLSPKNEAIYYRLGECYSKEQKWLSAIAAYEKAISLDPLKEEYLLALGACYFQIQDYTAAENKLKAAIEIAPEVSNCWIQYICFLTETHAIEKALELIEEAKNYTWSVEFNYCKVACLLAAGQRKAALDLLHYSLSKYNFDPSVLSTFLTGFEEDSEIKSIIALNQTLS